MHGNFRGLSTGARFAEFSFGIRGCGGYYGHSDVGIRIGKFHSKRRGSLSDFPLTFFSIRVWRKKKSDKAWNKSHSLDSLATPRIVEVFLGPRALKRLVLNPENPSQYLRGKLRLMTFCTILSPDRLGSLTDGLIC